jgi:hypothetical protein
MSPRRERLKADFGLLRAINRKLHEIVRTNEPENDPHRNGEPSPSGVMHDDRRGKQMPDAASLNLASASRKHILDPLALPTVGERNEKSLQHSKNIHWCPVDLARLSTDVGDDAEAGQSSGKSARDAVRDSEIESRNPPFAEPDQKDGSEHERQN